MVEKAVLWSESGPTCSLVAKFLYCLSLAVCKFCTASEQTRVRMDMYKTLLPDVVAA